MFDFSLHLINPSSNSDIFLPQSLNNLFVSFQEADNCSYADQWLVYSRLKEEKNEHNLVQCVLSWKIQLKSSAVNEMNLVNLVQMKWMSFIRSSDKKKYNFDETDPVNLYHQIVKYLFTGVRMHCVWKFEVLGPHGLAAAIAGAREVC